MLSSKKESSLTIDLIESQIVKEIPNEDLDSTLKEEIQNTINNFQECIVSQNFEFFLTPVLMLTELLDNNGDDKIIVAQILMNFQEIFPYFFSLIINLQLDSDLQEGLINVITYITCYLKYSYYSNYINSSFFQTLVEFFNHDIEKLNVIKIISNIFTEVDFDTQNFILSLASFLNEWPKEKKLQHELVRFIYIIIRTIQNFESAHIQFVNIFLNSFINCDNKYDFTYYYTFYSIATLIKRGFKIETFLQPNFIAIYNQCLYSNSSKILLSDFYVLLCIVNNSKYDNFNLLFDYKQAIEATFQNNQNENIILRGLDFLISSAAAGPQCQSYLHNLNLFPLIDHLFTLSSYKIRSDLAVLYINLVPRENFGKRIQLLETPFFTSSILLLIQYFDQSVQKQILNIIFYTLTKCESLNNKEFHYFLIRNGFIPILQELTCDNEKINVYVDNILTLLNSTDF